MSDVVYRVPKKVDLKVSEDWANLIFRLQQLSNESVPPDVHVDLKNMTLQVCGRVEKWGRPELVASG